MSRSQSKDREKRKLKYSSAKAMAEKAEAGFQGTYLRIPQGVKLYKPKVGKALLDVIPFEAQAGNPNAEEGVLHWERTFFVHRGIGPNQETYVCPARTAGKKCPICEDRIRLAEEDDDSSEDLRKALAPKERQIMAIQDRKEPDKGIQLIDMSSYCFGDEILQTIRAADEGEDWELFFSLEDGKTLRVTWEEDTIGRGQKFVRAGRVDFKDRDPLDEELLEQVPALDEIPIILEYSELKKKFASVASKKSKGRDEEDEDDDDDEEDEEEEEEEETPKSKKSKAKSRDDDEDEDDDDDDEDDETPKSKKKSKEVDDEEDDDEEPAPKKKKKPAADEDDDDDEEDGDGDDGDDEDDDEPKSKKKSKPSDDDDDEGEGEDEDDEDDDEEPKSKKKSKDDDDDDDGWDDFADDEDEAPKKKKSKK